MSLESYLQASIRGALEALGAERIAHRVRAIEDPALVAELAARQVALDVCQTSNVCLGVYSCLAQHSLPRLLAAGAVVTINSEDPALFGTILNKGVSLLAEPFGLDAMAFDEILVNAVRHSFLSEPAKQRLEATYRAELDALKAVHLQPYLDESCSGVALRSPECFRRETVNAKSFSRIRCAAARVTFEQKSAVAPAATFGNLSTICLYG